MDLLKIIKKIVEVEDDWEQQMEFLRMKTQNLRLKGKMMQFEFDSTRYMQRVKLKDWWWIRLLEIN